MQVIIRFLVSCVIAAAAVPVQAMTLPAPTVVQPDRTYTIEPSPVITGVTIADTRVAVYIDDVFNGYGTIVSSKNGVSSFAYTPFLPLTAGSHRIAVRAEDLAAGIRSDSSSQRIVTVEPALPEPILVGTVVNADSSQTQPWIVGLAASDLTVEIWIDDVFNGYTTATADRSGTGNFAYQPFVPLTVGDHVISARAVRDRSDNSRQYSRYATNVATTVTVTAASLTSPSASIDVNTTRTEVSGGDQTAATGDTTAADSSETTSQSATTVDSTTADSAEADNADTVQQDASIEAGSSAEVTPQTNVGDVDSNDQDSRSGTQVIGWILLVLAALLLARSLYDRRKEREAIPTKAAQLDFSADSTKRSHVQVVDAKTTQDDSHKSTD